MKTKSTRTTCLMVLVLHSIVRFGHPSMFGSSTKYIHICRIKQTNTRKESANEGLALNEDKAHVDIRYNFEVEYGLISPESAVITLSELFLKVRSCRIRTEVVTTINYIKQ